MRVNGQFKIVRLTAKLFFAVALGVYTAVPVYAKDLDIWFCPTRPAIQKDGRHTGAQDYDNLFDPDAPWQKAAAFTSVFKTYASCIANEKPEVLKSLIEYLRAHDMKLAFEYGPMNRLPGRPYVEAEGWAQGGAKNAQRVCERLKSLGGKLDYLAMDEPFWNGNIRPPKGYTVVGPYEMAKNAKITVDAVHSVFPKAQFGDTEPVQPTPGVDLVGKYALWLEAWRHEVGKPMAFFHLDVGWDDISNEEIAAIGNMCKSRNVPFGVIYNGRTHDENNRDWLKHAHDHFARYEVAGSLLPDQPVLQSWNFFPDRVLPESDPEAHTHQILQYVAHRKKLQAQ